MSVVDDYLATVSEAEREVLGHIRALVMQEIPDAEDVISYNLPAFRRNGKVILGFYANKHFMSIYPFSGGILSLIKDDIKEYRQTKSALQFTVAHQVPDKIIREIIRLRREEAGV